MPRLRKTFETSFLRMFALILVCVAIPLSAWAECLRDNGDGTLTDPQTGLIWQSCLHGVIWDGKACIGEPTELKWHEALLAAEANQFLGHSDWILPTKEQFEGALRSHCKRWNTQTWSSSIATPNANSAVFVYFDIEYADSRQIEYSAAFRLVRASKSTDINIFKASLARVPDQTRKAQSDYQFAKRTNTIAAFTQFVKDYPDAPQAKEVQDIVWQTAFDQAKRTNTVSAYAQFIKDYPNAPQAKAAQDVVWQTAFDQARRTNTVTAYAQFIKDFPYAPQRMEAKFERTKLVNTGSAYAKFATEYSNSPLAKEAQTRLRSLVTQIKTADSEYKCEEAKRLSEQLFETVDERKEIFDFDRCVAERKFHNVLTGANPQSMYLAGVKYENDKEPGKAKKVYLTIMDRFSEHAMALKAADRLAGMNDVAAVEDAQWRTRQAIEDSNEQARRASQEAADRQDRAKRDFCSGKSSCYGSCSGLSAAAGSRCWSACESQYSGCR